MNNKGFTLIELLATIVLLVLVITVSTYAVTNVIDVSDKKNWDILVSNIESACEVYYQENGSGEITVGKLLNDGYLITDQIKNEENAVINPVTDESINNCKLAVDFVSNKVSVTWAANCPNKETGE